MSGTPRGLPSAIERLSATGPFAPEDRDLMLFGRLVGAWDVEWAAFDSAGATVERRRGEWHFAWVLGGRGVQDVISIAGAPRDSDGTTLRCWDPELGAWRAVFMSPGDGEYAILVGRPDGDRIVQERLPWGSAASPAPAQRWTFSEITAESFLWQAQTLRESGGTCTVTHEIRAIRQGA